MEQKISMETKTDNDRQEMEMDMNRSQEFFSSIMDNGASFNSCKYLI